MRHVDEGTIHAWLDDQITDPAEAAWIEEHLRWCEACAARLGEERAMFDQANALLSAAVPGLPERLGGVPYVAEPPAFETLVAKAGNPIPEATTGSAVEAAYGRRWLLQAGWAASLALAVGIGWMAREIADREPAQSRVAQEESHAGVPADPEVRRSGVPGDPEERRSGVPGDSVVGVPASEVPSETLSAAAASSAVAPRPGTGATSNVGSDTPVERPAAPPRQEPARTAPPETSQKAANAAPPPAAPEPQLESARRELEGIAEDSAPSARRAFAPPPAAPAAVVPPPTLERVATTSASPARVVTTDNWQTLPRTEAAARSGMALYGIDGLEPTLTAISPDGRVVRTVYRLDAGTVELEQQRAPSGIGATAAQASRSAIAAQGRAGTIADTLAAPPRVWSGTRGDVRVTLRTPSASADLDALGARLRID